MAYNGSGTYIPPAGQPVATGTVIQSNTFNTLVTDIGNTFNNVLPRDGQASMAGQLKITDGTSGVPGIAFNSEASTGMYRPNSGALALVAGGVENMRINSAGRVLVGTASDDGTNKLQVNGPAKVSGGTTLASTLTVTGATTLSSTLGVTSNATVGGTLGVTGATSLSSVSTSGAATVGTTLGVTGATTLASTLGVTGSASLSSVSTSGAANVGTTLSVTGTSNFMGGVGVGTAAPGAKLDVESGSTSLNTLFGSTASTVELALSASGTTTSPRIGATGNDIIAKTNGVEVVRVNSAGKLGIGTSAPQTKLHVESGDMTVSNGGNVSQAGGALNFQAVSTTTAPMATIKGALDWFGGNEEQGKLIFMTRPTTGTAGQALTERMRIENSGKVGIGTTSPQEMLHIEDPNGAGIRLYDKSTNYWTMKATTNLTFSRGATEYARIDSNGNLGQPAGFAIGSGNGYAGNTTASSNGVLKLYDPADGYTRLANGYASGGILLNAYNGYVKVDAQGKLGVGVSPNYKLHVDSGDVAISNGGNVAQAGGSLYLNAMSSTTSPMAGIKGLLDWAGSGEEQGKLAFFTRPNTGVAGAVMTERMRIDSIGNVGIGTASPSAKLDVNGSVRVGAVVNSGATLGATVGMGGYSTSPQMRVIFNHNSGGMLGIGSNGSGSMIFGRAVDLTGTVETEQMRLDASGNVGINTTAPTARLDVGGNVANNAQAILTRGASDSNFQLIARNGSGSAASTVQATFGMEYVGSGTAAGLSFLRGTGALDSTLQVITNNTERARVTATGNLLVGTTTDNGSKLQVNGGATFGSQVLFAEGTSSAPGISFQNDGAPDTGLYHISDGSFGITCNTSPVVQYSPFTVIQMGTHAQRANGANGTQRTAIEVQQSNATARYRFGIDSTEVGALWMYDTSGSYTGACTWSNGNWTASGTVSGAVVTQTSDETKKENWQAVSPHFLTKLASINKVGMFDWIDTKKTSLGVGAQSLEAILPAAVHTDEEGEKTVNYGGAAMVSVVELTKLVLELQARIAALEAA
jgi:hypothetical protein